MRRAFGLKILNSRHKDVRRLKREGWHASIHGNKFWNSSFLLMDYLKKNPLKRRARVVEVGCGWGLLGIYCAKNFDARATGVDSDRNVLPFMELHAAINNVKVQSKCGTFESLTVDYLSNVDIILGSDICFWDEMTRSLYNLMRRASKAGVKRTIIADPCRPPFNDLVIKCKEKFEGTESVEKWLARPVHASGEILIVNH